MSLGLVILATVAVLISPGTVGAQSPRLNLARDVDNGRNPYEVELTLTNDTTDYGPTSSTCNGPPVSTQCQISFTVPAGQRYVVEHVSAYITGVSGQTYQIFLSLDVSEFLVMNKRISAPGIDTFTASQPMRVYVNANRVPPPSVAVTNSVGGNFFARVTLSGYLVSTTNPATEAPQ